MNRIILKCLGNLKQKSFKDVPETMNRKTSKIFFATHKSFKDVS